MDGWMAYRSGLPQEFDKVKGLGIVLRILPVDVEAVEAEVLDELDGGLGECLTTRWGGCWEGEVGRVGPSAD